MQLCTFFYFIRIQVKIEDDLLVVDFLHGDRGSFEKIYIFYYPLLFNYGRQFGVDELRVYDAIQDIFVDIWNSRNRLKILAIKPYLFRCLRNKIKKSLFKETQEKERAHKYWLEEFAVTYDPTTIGIAAETFEEVHKKLNANIEKLSPKQREIIFLIYYNDLSYIEVAEILNIKIKTAYNQVYKSIIFLRQALKVVILGAFFLGISA